MIHAQNCKVVKITPPAAIVDNAAYTTTELDTLGWDYVQIFVHLGATDIAIATLQVTESNTSGSGHAAVTGLVWGTSNNIAGSTSTIPSATDDNKFFLFEIDMRKGRKRYLDLNATAGNGTAGTYLTAWAVLWRGENSPVTASERGCQEILRV